MISGASEEELEIANDRADLLLEIDRLNNIISELEKDAIELMKKYKDINAPRYDMCKHFIYKITELKEKE